MSRNLLAQKLIKINNVNDAVIMYNGGKSGDGIGENNGCDHNGDPWK